MQSLLSYIEEKGSAHRMPGIRLSIKPRITHPHHHPRHEREWLLNPEACPRQVWRDRGLHLSYRELGWLDCLSAATPSPSGCAT